MGKAPGEHHGSAPATHFNAARSATGFTRPPSGGRRRGRHRGVHRRHEKCPARGQCRPEPVPANAAGGPDGKPDHGRVVVGKGYPSEENIDYISQDKDIFGICHTTFHEVPPPPDDPVLLVNQHCIDRLHVVWNYNLTSNNRRFYIHVTE